MSDHYRRTIASPAMLRRTHNREQACVSGMIERRAQEIADDLYMQQRFSWCKPSPTDSSPTLDREESPMPEPQVERHVPDRAAPADKPAPFDPQAAQGLYYQELLARSHPEPAPTIQRVDVRAIAEEESRQLASGRVEIRCEQHLPPEQRSR